MSLIDRRSAIKLSLLASVGLTALSRVQAQEAPASKIEDASTGAETPVTLTDASNLDPVLFWNAVSLDLVAYDHSVPATDARAPGPCATSYALAFVHAIIADAVKVAYDNVGYMAYFPEPLPPTQLTNRALFVGGAAAGVLAHIYNTDGHLFQIDTRRKAFFKSLAPSDLTDWHAGTSFASQIVLRTADSSDGKAVWEWNHINKLILPQFSTYSPKTRGHNIDPLNPGQGFYGSNWHKHRPFVSQGWDEQFLESTFFMPPELQPFLEGSPEYLEHLNEVQVKGGEPSTEIPSVMVSPRTDDEETIGLYWAYDGPRLIGTPPRLYNQIVRLIAEADGLSVPDEARLFALCNIAMADAGIATWYLKYKHEVWRPVLGVRNRLDVPDPEIEWMPLGAPKTNKAGPIITQTQTQNVADVQKGEQQSLSQIAAVSRANQIPTDTSAPAELVGGGITDFQVQFLNIAEQEDTAQSLLGSSQNLALTFQNATTCIGVEHPSFTPNFPAFPSGHATFGSACFEVVKAFRASKGAANPSDIGEALKSFYSDELDGVVTDFQPTPTCEPKLRERVDFESYPKRGSETASPLSNLDRIIEDNAASRVYLGVHWRFDSDVGVKVGKIIADRVVAYL